MSPDDERYFRAYDKAKQNSNLNQTLNTLNLGIAHEPPAMDVRVRMICDEDLKTLIVPRVKEMLYRVNRDAPFEAAAKALAAKNGHPDLWKFYSFSILRGKVDSGEDDSAPRLPVEEITDLRKRFGSFMRDDSYSGIQYGGGSGNSQELVFFYKVSAAFPSPFEKPHQVVEETTIRVD